MYQGFVHPGFESVADTFDRQLPHQRAGGAALTVYHQGKVVIDIWGGTRDKAGTPWSPDTLALSYSTSKGVASTLLHLFADRGVIDYAQRVAHYWPAFAKNGKSDITVRQLLCHEAGLYDVRALIDDAHMLNDWPQMLSRLEAARPSHHPSEQNGYHGLTYGYLIGGLLEKATGGRFGELLQNELARPLGVDGLYIGLPSDQLARAASLIRPEPKPRPQAPAKPRKPRPPALPQRVIAQALELSGFDNESSKQGLMPRGIARYDWNSPETLQACNPSANGMFNARSLATLYAMLANHGEWNGRRYLSPTTFAAISRVQNTRRGAVIPIAMRWRLGYHRVFTTGPRTPNAFGHFGFGGSGAWCDPSRGLSAGYVVNTGSGSPFGDLRLWRINSAIIEAAERHR